MYGKNGTKYNLDGTEFQVDEKFIVATLMAIIVSIREVNQENYPSIDAAIERMAESIYEQIKEVESDDIERTTDAPTQ
jgi:hypothetical protein